MNAKRTALTRWLAGTLVSMIAGGISAAEPAPAQPPAKTPIKEFAKAVEFTDAQLSPDGTYVALLVPLGRTSAVAFMRLADGKLTGTLHLNDDDHVSSFQWVNNERIVASIAIQDGPLDAPQLTGELVAINADGSKSAFLFGWRGSEKAFGSRLGGLGSGGTKDYAFGEVIDPLLDNHDEILISSRNWYAKHETRPLVYRLNVYNGNKTQVDAGPAVGDTDFVVDGKGQVRYAMTWDGGLQDKVWQKAPGQSDWRAVTVAGAPKATAVPMQFSKDGKSVFLNSTEFGPRSCLVQVVLDSGERHKMACSDSGDLGRVYWSFEDHGDPIAVSFSGSKPEVRMLETDNPNALILKQLLEAFPDKIVVPASSTRDGSKLLVYVADDRTPGDYYLFDTQTRKADYFAGLRQAVIPEQMGERRPISLKARDGTMLSGYLTLPQGVDPKNLPLVVHPHGGPFGVRDTWVFDREPQLMASRGYAVLQINFRGSSGYGSDFLEAGRKAWGTKMIDDITDATRWTIEQGYADPARVCISGASYGGYAALMSAVREPDLYKCVVAYAGVYDLGLLKRDSDTSDIAAGRQYLADAVAGTDAEAVAQSPITYLDRLKAPLLIVHGEQDRRAPFSQAKALRSALDKRGVSYEWMVRSDEGHGFWKVANVEAYYTKMLDFLDRNIGQAQNAKATSTAPAPAP